MINCEMMPGNGKECRRIYSPVLLYGQYKMYLITCLCYPAHVSIVVLQVTDIYIECLLRDFYEMYIVWYYLDWYDNNSASMSSAHR